MLPLCRVHTQTGTHESLRTFLTSVEILSYESFPALLFYLMANELCLNFLKDSDYSAAIDNDALKTSGSFENKSPFLCVLLCP